MSYAGRDKSSGRETARRSEPVRGEIPCKQLRREVYFAPGSIYYLLSRMDLPGWSVNLNLAVLNAGTDLVDEFAALADAAGILLDIRSQQPLSVMENSSIAGQR